jgi:hypothetical protein
MLTTIPSPLTYALIALCCALLIGLALSGTPVRRSLQQWMTQQRYRYLLIPLCVLLVCAGGAGVGIWLPNGQAHASSNTTSNTNPLPECKKKTIQNDTQGEPCDGQGPASTYCWANHAQPVQALANDVYAQANVQVYTNTTSATVYGYYFLALNQPTNRAKKALGTLTIFYSSTCGTNWLDFTASPGVNITHMLVQIWIVKDNQSQLHGYNVQQDAGGNLSVHTPMMYAPNTPVAGYLSLACSTQDEKGATIYLKAGENTIQPDSNENQGFHPYGPQNVPNC